MHLCIAHAARQLVISSMMYSVVSKNSLTQPCKPKGPYPRPTYTMSKGQFAFMQADSTIAASIHKVIVSCLMLA